MSTGKKWPQKRDEEWYVSEESNACILSVIQYDWDPEETGTTPVGKSVNIYQSARCSDVEWYVSEETNACILSVVQYDWDLEETGTTPVGKSVNIYQSARCNIPNDLHLHQHHSENLRSRNFIHCNLDICQVTFQHQNSA
jgi:hypothetical protein